jgi:DNA-directed RNA polymerase specialized sigma24 family protein
MVERRAIDFLRGRQRRERRERGHTRELVESTRSWMSPDLGYEEAELRVLQDRVLRRIPSMCRRAYLMVRDAEMSYDAVAANLGVSRSAVTSYVVRAQRRFRQELERQGIQARYRNGRPTPRDRDSLGWRPGPERRVR